MVERRWPARWPRRRPAGPAVGVSGLAVPFAYLGSASAAEPDETQTIVDEVMSKASCPPHEAALDRNERGRVRVARGNATGPVPPMAATRNRHPKNRHRRTRVTAWVTNRCSER